MTGESKCVWCLEPAAVSVFLDYDHVHPECQWKWMDAFAKNNPNSAWTKAYLAAKETEA